MIHRDVYIRRRITGENHRDPDPDRDPDQDRDPDPGPDPDRDRDPDPDPDRDRDPDPDQDPDQDPDPDRDPELSKPARKIAWFMVIFARGEEGVSMPSHRRCSRLGG